METFRQVQIILADLFEILGQILRFLQNPTHIEGRIGCEEEKKLEFGGVIQLEGAGKKGLFAQFQFEINQQPETEEVKSKIVEKEQNFNQIWSSI